MLKRVDGGQAMLASMLHPAHLSRLGLREWASAAIALVTDANAAASINPSFADSLARDACDLAVAYRFPCIASPSPALISRTSWQQALS
jgi:hypothetical protein